MLQKFAFSLKSKAIEFFAEEENEDDNASTFDLSAAAAAADDERIITDQRVIILKPDTPPHPNEGLIPSLFAAVSSFRSSYLQLQAAHSPLDPDALRHADADAVSHLRRLSQLRNPNPNPNPNPNLGPSFLEAQVQENQALLRTFEAVVNRLQADIDRKDFEAAQLRRSLNDSDAANSSLARKLKKQCCSQPELDRFLTVGLFDSALRDCCRSAHRFATKVVGLMKRFGRGFDSVANSIYPDVVDYEKPGHRRYTILSYVCLRMFCGFDSDTFCCEEGGKTERRDYIRQFVERLICDPLEGIGRGSDQSFAKFCERKYQQLLGETLESSVFGDLDRQGSVLGLLRPSNPLYGTFVSMASSVWMLHKLAQAYNPVVKIFQVGGGEEFSMVYMESVGRRDTSMRFGCGKALRPKVAFTVVPGFQVGKTVIQCRVYLNAAL